jgi:hypothetical protein
MIKVRNNYRSQRNPQPIGRGPHLVLKVPASIYSTALVAIVLLYHSALNFGYRFSVLKST